MTLTAICLFGQLAVPGLVCAQAYVGGVQSDLEMGFAFDADNSAVLLTRLEPTRGLIRVSGESVSGADPHPMAWTHHDPAPLPGLDEPVALRIRRIMPPHSILGPPMLVDQVPIPTQYRQYGK